MVNSAGLRLQLLFNYIDPSPLTIPMKETMLTRIQFDILNEMLSSTLSVDERESFIALSPIDKLNVTKAMADEKYLGFDAVVFPEFIVALAAQYNADLPVKTVPHLVDVPANYTPGTYDLPAVAADVGFQLVTTPIIWHKPKPPKLFPELLIKWPDEAAKISAIAAKIDFRGIANNECYQNAVHETLGLGGWLDFLLGRQIPASDPTMALFIMGASVALRTARGEWYDEDDTSLVRLPPSIDGKSVEAIDFDIDYENRLRRRNVARDSAAKRRLKDIADKKERRQLAFSVLNLADGHQTLVDALSLASFDKLREILTSNPIGVETAGGKTWLPTELLKKFESVYPIANPEMLEHTEQFVLAQTNKRLPNWFHETQDGSLKIRRAPRVNRPVGLDRPTRSLHLQLDKLITKHSIEKVGNALMALSGKCLDGKQLTWANLVSLADADAAAAETK